MNPVFVTILGAFSVLVWVWVVRRSIKMIVRDRVVIALCLIILGIVGGQFFALVKPEEAVTGGVLAFAAVGLLFLLFVVDD